MAANVNPLLYPKASDRYDSALFQNPTSEYRGAPFWSWNTRLERDQLLRQIDQLEEMGMGGFHIHCRVGLDTEYMGAEFMEHVQACVAKAKSKKMLACLYDEDRWPSGAAGGLVVKANPEYKAQHLLLTPWQYGSKPTYSPVSSANGKASRSELGFLLARYDIQTDQNQIQSIRRLQQDDASCSSTWYAYVEPNLPSDWYNGQTYVDTLNKRATELFVQLTHDKYHSALGEHFGTTVPSIFTDEPQFAHKSRLNKSVEQSDVFLPWTLDLPETFSARYEYSLLDVLPYIIWDTLDTNNPVAQQVRYHYHDYVCERFVEAFMDYIADWCKDRKIALIGHMMKEPTLLSQTEALGEAMRCYRNLDMPGVDILCDSAEYNTVKQATSVARQNGAKGVMSEVYGVTNWTFDFAGHKASGDWQAALGVTFRVHHLNWVSMAGEAKRDYPAAIGYQSPWYREYPYIENHFARVNVAMTRGNPRTRVAVIHPIESYWLCYGPMDTSGAEQTFREEAFEALTLWLSFGLVDFDFISESLLPDQCPLDSIKSGEKLSVGHCSYEAIIVPNLKTIRTSTLQRLHIFAELGGRVIIAGPAPAVSDGIHLLSCEEFTLFAQINWTKFDILQSLEEVRDISVMTKDDGAMSKKLLYQLREDGTERFLFVCNTDRARWYDTEVKIRGFWEVEVLETLSGESWTVDSSFVAGWTIFQWHFEAYSSLLVHMKPRLERYQPAQKQLVYRHELKTTSKLQLNGVDLSEQNILLLDYATYRINADPWQPEEEILRIENKVRSHFALPKKGEACRQPWSISKNERDPRGQLTLRYEFSSETTVSGAKLALECPQAMTINLDGIDVPTKVSGWWVDEEISTIEIPAIIQPGNHLLEVKVPFTILTNLERVYLLGDFAVRIRGCRGVLQKQNLSEMSFGDWTPQGLPFYAGNVTYRCSFDNTAKRQIFLNVPFFAGPVLSVDLDGRRCGLIAFKPNTIDLGFVEIGYHQVWITCFGNRENAFGALHMPSGVSRWISPNAWRTEHDWWIEGYNIKPMGVLDRPVLKIEGEELWQFPRNPERLWTAIDNGAVV